MLLQREQQVHKTFLSAPQEGSAHSELLMDVFMDFR